MRSKKRRIEEIPLASLRPHPVAQRMLIPARLRYLKKNWDFGEVGVLTVNLRDGVYWIINGQHRWKTGLDLGYGTTKVMCEIYTDLTDQECAAKFRGLNDQRAVAEYDKYEVGLVEGNTVYVQVRDSLSKVGLRATRSGSKLGTFSAISAARVNITKNPVAWDSALSISGAAWGTIPAAVDGVLLTGIFKVMDKHNGSVDKKALINRLAKYPGGPGALRGAAKHHADLIGSSVVGAVGDIVIRQYNKGRSEAKSLAPL